MKSIVEPGQMVDVYCAGELDVSKETWLHRDFERDIRDGHNACFTGVMQENKIL